MPIQTSEEKWRTTYRLRPYLSYATEKMLQLRASDALNNFVQAAADGRITPVQSPVVEYWGERMAHLQVEVRRRGKSLVEDISLDHSKLWMKSEAFESIRSNAQKFPDLNNGQRRMFRFGELTHIESFYKSGEILLKPASAYAALTTDRARQDNELELEAHITPYDYDLNLLSPLFKKIAPSKGWHTITYRKPTNFYVFCLTSVFNLRFFCDFKDATACVAIHDIQTFESRLRTYLKWRFPGWTVGFHSCRYVDPFFLPTFPAYDPVTITLWKDARYMYQREHRFVIIPPTNVEILPSEKLLLGSLEDISSVHSLS